MGRISSIGAVVAAAIAVAGCGSAGTVGDPSGLRLTTEPPGQGPAAVEPTAGRLGPATEIRTGERLRALSRGGRPDARPRTGTARRDGVGAGAACANAAIAPAAANLAAVTAATLCLLNGERADRGLPPLTANAKLASAATAYAQDLVAGQYFSHAGRDGSDVLERIERSGYVPDDADYALGENLAWGTGSLGTPGAIMVAWMNSEGHRANILDPDFREVGIGVAVGNPSAPDGLGATYATEFGVIEGGSGDDAPAAQQPAPATKQPSSSAKRKQEARKRRARARRHRARARRARAARAARAARHGGKRHNRGSKARRVKSRGPIAHIAI
jgi:uncharacterized protein YkwD